MNKLQQAYAIAKAAYDTALEAKDWDLVEELEDGFLEAEAAMVEWALDHAEKTKMIPAAELKTIRDRWIFPPFHDRMVDMAFKLAI